MINVLGGRGTREHYFTSTLRIIGFPSLFSGRRGPLIIAPPLAGAVLKKGAGNVTLRERFAQERRQSALYLGEKLSKVSLRCRRGGQREGGIKLRNIQGVELLDSLCFFLLLWFSPPSRPAPCHPTSRWEGPGRAARYTAKRPLSPTRFLSIARQSGAMDAA